MATEQSLPQRRRLAKGLSVLCLLGSLYYLYTGFFGMRTPFQQMIPLLLIGLVMAFLSKPLTAKRSWARYIDYVLAGLSVFCCLYLLFGEQRLMLAITLPESWDLFTGIVLFFLVVEAARRVLGWAFVGVVLAFTLYALLGRFVPGIFHHFGLPVNDLVLRLSLSQQGVLSMPMSVVSTQVVFFMIFAAFLQAGGGAEFIVNLSRAVFGRTRGGPAKMAVSASCLFGMISGSAVANVATTGMITIPLMKRIGYTPQKAGAIEALASSGGQFMPPIMGASAFLMAEFIGVTYWAVVVAAFLPALLYYVALFVLVDIEAVRTGLSGLPSSELPPFRRALSRGWVFVPPLFILVFLLGGVRLSATWSCLWALVSLVLFSLVYKQTRMTPRVVYRSLDRGMGSMTDITVACAAAGIVMGVVYATNFGIALSSMLIELSHGILLILLLLTAIVSLILGMGMTTVACYLFLSMLVAPALVKMGIPVMAAHLFIFYFGCLSAITPPVCLASYVGAGIAGVKPMAVGWLAAAWGSIAYILPFFFVYNPALMLQGPPGEIALAFVSGVLGAICFAAGIQSYFRGKLNGVQRLLFFIIGLAMIYPGWRSDATGLALFALVTLWQRSQTRKSGFSTAIDSGDSPGSRI